MKTYEQVFASVFFSRKQGRTRNMDVMMQSNLVVEIFQKYCKQIRAIIHTLFPTIIKAIFLDYCYHQELKACCVFSI